MAANSLQELYVAQLQDLYDAEQQIIKALPEIIQEIQSDDLREVLSGHLDVTKIQAERIETICEELGVDPEREMCKGMEGVLKEGSELRTETGEEVRDSAIIAACQRMEHYETAGYGTARAYAELLGYDGAAKMLTQSWEEEKETGETLWDLAEGINIAAYESEIRTNNARAKISNDHSAVARSKKGGRRVA